jgi:bacterioferritin-associated ferredoxin
MFVFGVPAYCPVCLKPRIREGSYRDLSREVQVRMECGRCAPVAAWYAFEINRQLAELQTIWLAVYAALFFK